MKRTLAVSLIALLLFLLTACGDTPDTSDAPTGTTTAAVTSVTTATQETTASSSKPTDTTGNTVLTTTAKETTAMTTAKPTTASPYSENTIEFYGRFLKSADGWQFDWSGSTIEAGFNGTKVELQINLVGGATTDYFNVYIDGGEPTLLTVNNAQDWYTLAEDLPKGYHSVRLEKRTEGPQGAICEFVQFDFGRGGKAAPAPTRKARTIEFAGSSNTAGYGNMAANGWTGFKLIEEDVAHSYGKLTADALNANAVILGWSGGGMYQDLGGNKSAVFSDNVFWRTLARKDNKDWTFEQKPDVLVINLGVNDFQANSKKPVAGFAGLFTDSCVQFLKEARKLYPDTHFVFVLGPNSFTPEDAIYAAIDAVAAEGDLNVSYVPLKCDMLPQSERFGADGHPSAKAHAVMAEQLTAHIAQQMGW